MTFRNLDVSRIVPTTGGSAQFAHFVSLQLGQHFASNVSVSVCLSVCLSSVYVRAHFLVFFGDGGPVFFSANFVPRCLVRFILN